MSNYKAAQEVLNNIHQKVANSEFFTGIEIAAYKDGESYSDDLCVRVLVSDPSITHKDLDIPKTLKNIPIVIKTSVIRPL